MSNQLVEALKEFLRTIILGEIPILGGILLFIKSGIDITVGTFNINWMIALAMFVSGTIGVVQTALMSAADKWLHVNDVKTVLDLEGLNRLKQ